MGRNLGDFTLGQQGDSANDPKFAGPAPIKTSNSDDKFAANANTSLAGSGTY
jgi:hypothetical protein